MHILYPHNSVMRAALQRDETPFPALAAWALTGLTSEAVRSLRGGQVVHEENVIVHPQAIFSAAF